MAESASLPAPASQIYTVAVIIALLSLLLVLLILPPLFWHFHNRNIGATSLVAWTVVLLFSTFINALIWPSDNIPTWFNGQGLCDIEVRLQSASQVALPASFAAVLRGLAAVLDTDHATVMQTKAQRRRNTVIDLLFCVCAPSLQVIFYELVHFRRYGISGIAGCTPIVSDSWLSFVLIFIPPLLWTLLDAIYAVLILARLYRYRLTFTSILATNQTTKSRFLRLYLICCLWITAFLPLMLYIIALRFDSARQPFSWSETHDPDAYNAIFMVASNGVLFWDRWVWLVTGACIFLFFGCGREAMAMYRKALLTIGCGRCFPALARERTRRSTVSTISSISSKAKMLFARKSSTSDKPSTTSTWSSGASSTSPTTHHLPPDEPISPKTTTFLEAIREVPFPSEQQDVEKAALTQTPASKPSSLITRFTSLFTTTPRECCSAPMPLAELRNETATVRSEVSAGRRPAWLVHHVRDTSADVLVRTEVRQGSEHEGACCRRAVMRRKDGSKTRGIPRTR